MPTPIELPTNFFAQLLVRLFSEKPWFFKVIQIAAIVLGIVSKVLDVIGATTALPGWLAWLPGGVTQIAAVVAVIIAQLPVKADTTPAPPAA